MFFLLERIVLHYTRRGYNEKDANDDEISMDSASFLIWLRHILQQLIVEETVL